MAAYDEMATYPVNICKIASSRVENINQFVAFYLLAELILV